jgi:hypothetical protein
VDAEQLHVKLRTTLGMRVGDRTAEYILGKLSASKTARPFPIFASDARTGHPIRPTLNPADFDDSEPNLFSLF